MDEQEKQLAEAEAESEVKPSEELEPTQDPIPADAEPQSEEEVPPTESEESQPVQDPIPEPAPAPEAEPQPAEEMIPQSKVNELIGKVRQETREKAMAEGRSAALQELVERYGVDSEDALNAMFGNGQRYDALNGEYDAQSSKLKALEAENVLLKSGVDRSRFDDVLAILEHNNMEVTPEAVEKMKLTHPEWTGESSVAAPIEEKPVEPVVRKLGALPKEGQAPSAEDDEKSAAMKLLGF